MPQINVQAGAFVKTPDGRQFPMPPQGALAQLGPRLQITVELADQVAQELIKRKEPLPAPSAGFALIDTGSASSCIDEETATSMHLPIVGRTKLATASHKDAEANQYPIKLKIQGVPIAFNLTTAIGVPIKCQGLMAIIGRDMLQLCCFIYNGGTGTITLCL
jgi:predicted aspartyl protease